MGTPVKFINTRIYLNGSNVGVHECSWKASIVNDLPDRFTTSDSVPQRTGEISWSNSTNIVKHISPMDSGYPHPGDEVRVVAEVTVNGVQTDYEVFTGRIDTTTGGMGVPLVSKIIDNSDDLNSSVSWYPLLQRMPRRQNTNWSSPFPGLTVGHLLEEVARQCGFGARYPAYRGFYALVAPLAGSTWTDFIKGEGALNASSRSTSDAGSPRYAYIAGQRGLYEGFASWDNAAQQEIASNGFWIDYDILGMNTSTYCRTGVRFKQDSFLYLTIDSGALYVHTAAGASERIQAVAPGNHTIGVFYPDAVGAYIWVRVDGEMKRTGLQRTETSHYMMGTDPNEARTIWNAPMFIDKYGAGLVSYLIIGRMTMSQTGNVAWREIMESRVAPKSIHNTDPELAWLDYVPGIEAITGKEALEMVCKPFCVSSWLDGQGALHYESGQQLRLKPSQFTLTESEYQPLEWISNYTHAASRVTTAGKMAEVTMRYAGTPTVEAWSGSSSDTLADNYRNTYIVEIPDNEDYFEVDTSPVNLIDKYWAVRNDNSAVATERLNGYWRGVGSVFALALTNSNESSDNFDDRTNSWEISCSVDRVGVKTYKVTIGYRTEAAWIRTTNFQLPKRVSQRMDIKDANYGMPVLRAGAGVTLRDAPVESVSTGGPKGPELIHDMENFGGGAAAARMRTVLADYFSTEHPVFEEVTTSFDPRIDVGLCHTIDATSTWGYRFKVLVTSVTHDAVEGTTTYTPRVISASKLRRTYAEVAKEFPNYSALALNGKYSDI